MTNLLRIHLDVAVHSAEEVREHSANDEVPARFSELDGLDAVEICTSYRCGDQTLTDMPSDSWRLSQCEPVYESMPGWSEPTRGARRLADLPAAARRYVARLEEVSGVPAAIISTGSDRTDTILRHDVIANCRMPSFQDA